MNKSKIIIFGILSFFGLLISLYFIEESFTDVVLHMGNSITTTIYEEYNDPGLDLFHNNKLVSKDSYSIKEVWSLVSFGDVRLFI